MTDPEKRSPFGDEGLVEIDGSPHYSIPNLDAMAPFLMSIVSDGDRWMFVSSTGALTAGRGDARAAIFPYETDDRLHAAAGTVGPVTRMRVRASDRELDWRPFCGYSDVPGCRALAKSVVGDSLIFHEHHDELGLTFRYRWNTTERHGFVRTATLSNEGTGTVHVDLVDGLRGVLPHGLEPVVYERLSNLSNAYKRSELIDNAGRLAVFSLESPVSDRAEPQEVLKASVVWSSGLDGAKITLDAAAVRAFERHEHNGGASLVSGRPGAYLLSGALELAPGESATWHIVADVGRDQSEVIELRRRLATANGLADEIDEAIEATGNELVRIMALADANQSTGDAIACAHQVANVTYNVMRGGVPLSGYRIDAVDFAAFVAVRNRRVRERHEAWFRELPAAIDRHLLLDLIAEMGDVHLLRLGREYLPLSFSRRHGDPSRPWNSFSIKVHDDLGKPVIHYEGNWRDVFQNWEALCVSFPQYLPGLVTMFVNASTADGHNPYRITREGIDWEVPEPDDPWCNIGYWGDHQLIYLLRLLEASDRFVPGEVAAMLVEPCFTYADVPYRIAGYDEMVEHPKATITFDDDGHARSGERVHAVGGDGKLLHGPDGQLIVVTLVEKLLVAALAKVVNFVPGGGVWMNTQRPEWNDANNALVGYGLSMVTLYHLRRFLDHLRALVAEMPEAAISSEVATWLEGVTVALRETPVRSADGAADRHRKQTMDELGRTATAYRECLYDHGMSGETVAVGRDAITELCDLAGAHLDATIEHSRRGSGLVHSYNLLEFSADRSRAAVRHLPEMLEGQVAVLASGVLDPAQQAELLDALFASELYRPDQLTFMLAPVIELPGFVDKNIIPVDEIEANELLAALISAGDHSVVVVDVEGRRRFAPELVDELALFAALDRLAEAASWHDLVRRNRQATIDTYEQVFRHRSFMGRSASMYAYEGIGSVYWHMVAKLLLATQEAATAAATSGAGDDVVARLVDAFERVRAGLGFNKSAAEFGAVPIDPYSHTPAHAGAQQPGMTGAVKEELLVRPSELGVRVDDGRVIFDQTLLRWSELLQARQQWTVVTVRGEPLEIELDAQTLGLTICQVPVIVGLADGAASVRVDFTDGTSVVSDGLALDHEVSAMLFGRTGDVQTIRATFPR